MINVTKTYLPPLDEYQDYVKRIFDSNQFDGFIFDKLISYCNYFVTLNRNPTNKICMFTYMAKITETDRT